MDKTKKKKIFKIIADTLLGLIFAGMAVLVGLNVVSKITNKPILGENVMWVRSDSMEPTIEMRSYILTEKVGDKELKPGDIITFVVPDKESPIYGQNNTHRIIRIEEDGKIVTKGDNNLGEDKPISREDVVAVYKRNMPLLTFFGRLFATPAGFVLTVLIIIGGTSAWFAIDIRDRKKKQKQKVIDELVQEEVKKLEEEAKERK